MKEQFEMHTFTFPFSKFHYYCCFLSKSLNFEALTLNTLEHRKQKELDHTLL